MDPLKNPIILFPLPSTVFYPGTQLPLHIFEPRYRKMVENATDTDSLIGIVLLKPGWNSNYFGRPPVEEIGCAGKINFCKRFPDGRFNIILQGLSRFRILEESEGNPFRLAKVDFLKPLNDHSLQTDSAEIGRNLIFQYQELLESMPLKKDNRPLPKFQDCETVGQAMDQIAYYLDWNIKQKQAFLEERNVQSQLVYIQTEIELKSQILRVSSKFKKNKIDPRLN